MQVPDQRGAGLSHACAILGLRMPPAGTNAGCCWSCKAAVWWGVTVAGEAIPLDVGSRADGNLVIRRQADGSLRVCHASVVQQSLFSETRYVSHFATCPNADLHRKPK